MFFDKYEKLCKEVKKTPTGVAIELGIGRATVSYWRNGNTPKQDILNKISDYFNVSVDYLLGKTDIKEAPHVQTDAEREKVKNILDMAKDLPDDEIDKILDYIDLLISRRNSEQNRAPNRSKD